MKKIFLGACLMVMTMAATSCGGGSQSAGREEKVLGDSLSYSFGQTTGGNVKEMVERQKQMARGQQADLDIDKFLKGVAVVLNADTTDSYAYITGMSFALQRIFQMKAQMAVDTVPFNTNLFLKGFKEVYNDTTQGSLLSSKFSEYQNRLNVLHNEKETVRLAEEAKKNGEKGTSYVDSVKAADAEVQVTETGLVYKILEPGSETKVQKTDKIKLNYVGRTIDGEVFDETNGNPREMGVSGFIPGFTEGLMLLGEGGKAVLYIPGNLAYGERGIPHKGIGANSTLVFEVEVVEIVPAE